MTTFRLAAVDASGQRITRTDLTFEAMVRMHGNLILSGYIVAVTDADGERVPEDSIPPAWALNKEQSA